MLLSAHFGEIGGVTGRGLQRETVRGTIRRDGLHRLQVRDQREQTLNREDVKAGNECGFGRIARGDKQRAEAPRAHTAIGKTLFV